MVQRSSGLQERRFGFTFLTRLGKDRVTLVVEVGASVRRRSRLQCESVYVWVSGTVTIKRFGPSSEYYISKNHSQDFFVIRFSTKAINCSLLLKT